MHMMQLFISDWFRNMVHVIILTAFDYNVTLCQNLY